MWVKYFILRSFLRNAVYKRHAYIAPNLISRSRPPQAI